MRKCCLIIPSSLRRTILNIRESKRYIGIRWGEYNNTGLDSYLARHLNKTLQYSYNCTILENASKHARTRKKLEATHTALIRPG